MPVVKYKGRKFVLRWKPAWDAIVRFVVNNFKDKNGRVDWLKAQKQGFFKDVPVPLATIRCRPAALKRRTDPEWKKRDARASRKWQLENRNRINERMRIKDSVTASLKKPLSRQRWSKSQIRLLLSLVKRHRHGKLTDWKSVLKDNRTMGFPQRDPLILSRYVNMLKHPGRAYTYPKYKLTKEQRKRYREKVHEKAKKARKIISDFLYSKVKA